MRLLCAGALHLGLACAAQAADTVPSYPEILIDDARHVLSVPACWAGALIGTLVGKSVVAHNRPMRSGQLTLLPEITPGLVGVRLDRKF